MKTTGEILRELREDRGEQQKDVALKLNIAQNTLSGYESDSRKPNIETLRLLASYYGVTADFLLGDQLGLSSLEKEFPDAIREIRRANAKLSPRAKKKLAKVLKAFIDDED